MEFSVCCLTKHAIPVNYLLSNLINLICYRLSQAHCRLMYRATILPMDAVIAISLVDLSMQDCTLNDTVDALHSTFQKYPDFDYLCLAKKLLTKLNLYEIWQNELLYYGKLLQVDHKTLEADIERGNPKLFAKYDDVTDDSIQLSASLVTSSYFKANKDKDLGFIENKENKSYGTKAVNDKLAATLKKHANLNKEVKKPPVVQKKKRKRKEVTVETSVAKNKMAKKIRKSKKSDSGQDSDGDFEDNAEALKGVPSVNDFFADLGIDFNFASNSHTDSENLVSSTPNIVSNCINDNENHDKIVESIKEKLNDSTKYHKPDKNIENKSDKKESIEVPGTSKSLHKLKQFSFNKSHDFDKYEVKSFTDKSPVKSIQKLDHVKGKSCITSNEGPSAQSSQISIFESSDCDIDLDI